MSRTRTSTFPIRQVPRNTLGRDFVVGDIHGEFDILMRALERLDFDFGRDRLFAVGDLVDRGPKSLECLELIREPWFFSVVGNHEDMMFEEVLGESYCGIRTWIPNGGDWWFDHADCPQAHRLVAEAHTVLPLALEIDHASGLVGIVHASPPGRWTPAHLRAAGSQSHLLWDRQVLNTISYEYPEVLPPPLSRLYMGHTPLLLPLSRNGLNWIDTGAVYTGNLTIIAL